MSGLFETVASPLVITPDSTTEAAGAVMRTGGLLAATTTAATTSEHAVAMATVPRTRPIERCVDASM